MPCRICRLYRDSESFAYADGAQVLEVGLTGGFEEATGNETALGGVFEVALTNDSALEAKLEAPTPAGLPDAVTQARQALKLIGMLITCISDWHFLQRGVVVCKCNRSAYGCL